VKEPFLLGLWAFFVCLFVGIDTTESTLNLKTFHIPFRVLKTCLGISLQFPVELSWQMLQPRRGRVLCECWPYIGPSAILLL
jgi:hypothetical protein